MKFKIVKYKIFETLVDPSLWVVDQYKHWLSLTQTRRIKEAKVSKTFSTWSFWICDIEEAFWERKCIVVFPKPTFCFPFFRLEAIRRERGGEGGEGIAVKIKFIWKNWFLSFYQAERISNPIICVFTAVHFRRHVFILDVLIHLSISLPEHRRLFWIPWWEPIMCQVEYDQ